MDTDGVAGQLLLHGHGLATTPFFGTSNDAYSAELRRVAADGFSGVFLPGSVYEPELPPHHDQYFDPFWAACEEAGLVLVLHAAFGAQQGTVLGMMRNKQRMKERLIEKDPEFAKL